MQKEKRGTANTLKCVFQADFQNRSTFIWLHKKQVKKKTEVPEYCQTGLDILTLYCFSLPGE